MADRRCWSQAGAPGFRSAYPLLATGLRATILTGASLMALVTLSTPSVALRNCGGLPSRIISGPFLGTVVSNGGAITVETRGIIVGRPNGVIANDCNITTLLNEGAIGSGASAPGGNGGYGVDNSKHIAAVRNSGAISGGNGGSSTGFAGIGGSGIANGGGPGPEPTIDTLYTSGEISGGAAGKVASSSFLAYGGDGIDNAGLINTLTINGGNVIGGAGGNGGAGGDGVFNYDKIGTLFNIGSISGGAGGDVFPLGGAPHGAGVDNVGSITYFDNSGKIIAGAGGIGAAGGAGVVNGNSITALNNRGTIFGGAGGAGSPGGAGLLVAWSGYIQTLDNIGAISGGAAGGFHGNLLSGGDGVENAGVITSLWNLEGYVRSLARRVSGTLQATSYKPD